jgi:hypothetical protein
MYMKKRKTTFLLWVAASTAIIIIVFAFFNSPLRTKPIKLTSLPQFPELVWSKPQKHSIDTVLYPNTESETLIAVDGESIVTETETQIATYIFYDEFIRSQGYKQIDTNGKPYQDSTWTASYIKNKNYFEIQHYPTPYKSESHTLLLFSGKIINQ